MSHEATGLGLGFRGLANPKFATPEVPSGMRYDHETGMVLPADTHYAAAWTRLIAGMALGVLLFAGTLGIGYLAWSVAAWGRGQTPAQRLLGLRCWNPGTGQVLGRGQMAQRQFLGLVLCGLSVIVLLFSAFSGRSQTSVGDVILGTIVLHDPQDALLS